MAEIDDLNTTDASNTARFPEGQLPSTVNNGARALEGMLARGLGDSVLSALATAGSSNTYTLTPNRTVAAYADGQHFRAEANHTNTGAATLNVSSLGAKSIVLTDGSALYAGAITSGGKYDFVYDGTNFFLVNPTQTGANIKTLYEAESDTNAFTDAEQTKVGHLTVTQAVDLDAIETRVNALDAAVVLMGTWDASAGTFPGSGTAQAGESYIVSVAGTVDSVAFAVNDRVIAITDNASTTTYASNWHKADYTDEVLSVAGETGAISAGSLRTAINVEDGADVTDATNVATALTNGVAALTSGEVTQLANINTNSITTTQWGYLAGLDQSLGQSNSPTFSGLTVSGSLTVDTNTLYVDSSNDRVGIGTTSPERLLHLENATEPTIVWERGNSGSNEKIWRAYMNSASFQLGTVTDDFSSGQTAYQIDRSGSGVTAHNFYTGNTLRTIIDSSGHLTPGSDNGSNLGTASKRWSEVFAANGTINTSDGTQKTLRNKDGLLTDAEYRAWARVQWVVFQWNDAIAEKGPAARMHTGVIAQQVAAAFEAEGLDPFTYSLLCRDPIIGREDDDMEEQWGIRYSEALAFEAAYQRTIVQNLEARVAVLEAAMFA